MQKLLWPFNLKGRYRLGSLVSVEDVTKCALKKRTAFVAHVGQMDFANTVMNFRFLYKEKNCLTA
jgi:hypothetical protein